MGVNFVVLIIVHNHDGMEGSDVVVVVKTDPIYNMIPSGVVKITDLL